MSSYLSNLLTTTSSRVKAFIPTNSETDGDTEDDTHLCRVLRAYYVEKGRPFPAWLPPDPKAPPPVVMATTVTPYPPVGAGYGGLQQGMGGGAPTSKLGSLWDAQPQQQQVNQPQSLRAGRGVASRSLRDGGAVDPYGRNNRTPEPQQVTARPLPSQRAGSVQQGMTPPSSSGTGTAQDRLKARLWGAARQASPGPGSQGSSAASLSSVSSAATASARNPYAPQGGGYDDRSGSFGSSRTSPGGGERPFVAATAPWASSANEFSGGGYGAGSGYGDAGGGGAPPNRSGRVGLPSGPRGGGLPGGPRSTR